MTEEEQLKVAMELSLNQCGGPTPTPAPSAPQASPPCVSPPDRGKPRRFTGKDAQDPLPQCSRGSSAKKFRAEPQVPDEIENITLTEVEALELLMFVFGDGPELENVTRWLDVGFQFSPTSNLEWGLWQRQGGPCGIFAPVQGFIVKSLCFLGEDSAADEEMRSRRGEHPLACNGEEDARPAILAHALATILYQSTPKSNYVVCQVAPRPQGDAIAATTGENSAVDVHAPGSPEAGAAAAGVAGSIVGGTCGVQVSGRRVKRCADAQALLEEAADTWLSGSCGVLSFLCSVLLTRTLAVVREDMDDMTTPFIGNFGHCSQELVNLMLIGEATSNVFDGSKWLGDDPSSGFLVKGVDGDRVGTPQIGYLSEMEPMRYLTVGTLYKHPENPIWVLGSPTHYTLFFSLRRSDARLSEEALVEQRAKQIFNDSALDEGSIAMSTNLSNMLTALGIGERLAQAERELVREEVILWEDFRSWTCRQFGCGSDGHFAGKKLDDKKITLHLYDGQDPPGPSLRSVSVELSDIDPRLAGGGSEGDSFAATLHTRWPNSIVQGPSAIFSTSRQN